MSRRVALTGATGFIGRHVSAQLLARGDSVRAVLRPGSSRPVLPGVDAVSVPLEARPLAEAFQGVDVVVNLAGLVASARAEAFTHANVDVTRAVAEAARATGALLVHISSLAAMGPAPIERPRDEADPPAPLTPYACSKLAGEQAVTSVPGLRWTILRPAAVYGPGDRALFALIEMADRGILPVVGRPGAAYTFVHVSDVVRAIEAAMAGGVEGEALFVGHPRPVTTVELAEAIREVTGNRAVRVRVPAPVVRGAAVACDIASRFTGRPLPLNSWRAAELFAEGFVCRVDRLRDRLGIVAAIDLPEGLAATTDWYRQAGWLKPLGAPR